MWNKEIEIGDLVSLNIPKVDETRFWKVRKINGNVCICYSKLKDKSSLRRYYKNDLKIIMKNENR